jgi:endonuclease YncB( thermonuclease family)
MGRWRGWAADRHAAACILYVLSALSASAGFPGRAEAEPCRLDEIGTGAVARVIDGRTFRLADGREIRLAAVEAPGIAGGDPDARRTAALSARTALQKLLDGKSVILRRVGA